MVHGTHFVGNLGSLCRLGGLCKEHESDREDQEEGDDESLNGSHDDRSKRRRQSGEWWGFKVQLCPWSRWKL